MRRIIFHVDVNAAYLSWEAVYRLRHLGAKEDLRRQAAGVAGDAAMRHGIILSKSVPAKKYGITTGEPIVNALKKCPFLEVIPPDYTLYENYPPNFAQEAFLKPKRHPTVVPNNKRLYSLPPIHDIPPCAYNDNNNSINANLVTKH